MKKSISKTIVTIAIVTAFLMPLMGNTALADTTVTFYFNSRDRVEPIEEWESNQNNMIDGDPDYTFASTTIDGDVQLLNGNTCLGYDLGTIGTVEIRACGYYTAGGVGSADIILQAVFPGGDGDDHTFNAPKDTADWSAWFDITNDDNSPGSGHWTWTDVMNLDCDVKSLEASGSPELFCSKVEIQVTYTT